jgi:hypothetical protein
VSEEPHASAIKGRAKKALAAAGRAAHVPAPAWTVLDELQRRSVIESADMIAEHLRHAALVSTHSGIQELTASRLSSLPHGLFLEFGFHVGHSARVFAPQIARRGGGARLFAFDAFRGLRNTWSQIDHTAGAFDLGGQPPATPEGVELVVGWLEETLPGFLEQRPEPISFIHFDLDVYEPTRFGLEAAKPRLQSGSLLLFDELHGYPGWREFEWRALHEVFAPDEFDFVAFGPEQALIKIR